MGAIVLDQIRTFGNQVPSHLIIDGQQRLTTFQIILAVLRDLAREFGATEYAEELERYLKNSGIMEKPEEVFKLWPSRGDQGAFRQVVGAEWAQVDTLHRIIQCYQYFSEVMRNFVTGRQAERDGGTQVELLYQVLRNDLEAVSIELEGDDDPQVIFETLNARGEPLLPSDLLRNFLLWRAERNDEDKDRLYQEYWAPLDDKFWKQEERIGRLKRPRIDIFLQHYLEYQKAEEVNVARLFHEYQMWTKSKTPFQTVEEELKSLTQAATIYRRFIEPNPEHSLEIFIWRMKLIDVGTIYPLLLFILIHSRQANLEVPGMFTDLESYLFRRLVCGLTTKNYNRVFLQLIRDLNARGVSREVLRASLRGLTGDASVWPDDERFAQSWTNRSVYTEIKPAQRLVVILRAVEDQLHSEKSERISIHSPLTLEHVMPQEWYTKWPLWDGTHAKPWYTRMLKGEKNPEAEERERLLHTFGNLTLLTHPLNSSVGNGNWETKRPEICKQSALALNRYFQDAAVWDSEQILERGRWLLQTASRVWPY
jgi:hypothetical protein